MRFALFFSAIDGSVSGMVKRRSSVAKASQISWYNVHLHVTVICRKPDVTGPRAGPTKVIMENTAIAFPRSIGPRLND